MNCCYAIFIDRIRCIKEVNSKLENVCVVFLFFISCYFISFISYFTSFKLNENKLNGFKIFVALKFKWCSEYIYIWMSGWLLRNSIEIFQMSFIHLGFCDVVTVFFCVSQNLCVFSSRRKQLFSIVMKLVVWWWKQN